MIIRHETEKDYREVENLTREAFFNVYRPGCNEHYVLHVARSNPRFVPELDYVIEEDGRIVANIVYLKGYLTLPNGEKRDVLIFGPVSVLPEFQKKGYGSVIIDYTLEKAKNLGYTMVAITGNPEYYNRFGFEPASRYGIRYDGVDEGDEAPFFMVKLLDGSTPEKGVYTDPEVYFQDEKDVEEFDKTFPPKKKEKRPGQLG